MLGWADGQGVNAVPLVQSLRLNFGGWLAASAAYSFAVPGDRFNGPVTFIDRSGEPQLNQLYFYVERPVDQQGEHWDTGGRVDAFFGTDAVFAQASGDPNGHWDRRLIGGNRFYQAALPQAYLDVVAPLGNGVRMKLGHFYTPIGKESVMAPDNLFTSHSYLMQYGEPFTHTGVLFSYAPSDGLTLNAGAVTGSPAGGWDGVFDRNLERWAFLGGVTWAPGSGATLLSVNGIIGRSEQPGKGDLGLYSIVASHDFTDYLHFTLQHDHGWGPGPKGTSAEWYGIAQYLSVDLNDSLEAGLRAEWFRDDDGVRITARTRTGLNAGAAGDAGLRPLTPTSRLGEPVGSHFFGVTIGLGWRPLHWLVLRPNLRFDKADAARLFDCGAANCGRSAQWLVSAEILVTF